MKKIRIQILLMIVFLANVASLESMYTALQRYRGRFGQMGPRQGNRVQPGDRAYSTGRLPGGMQPVVSKVGRSSLQQWGAWLVNKASSLFGWNKQSSEPLSERVNPEDAKVSIVRDMCDELDKMAGKSGTFADWESRVGPHTATYEAFRDAFWAAADKVTTINDIDTLYDILYRFLILRDSVQQSFIDFYKKFINDASSRIVTRIKGPGPQLPDELKGMTVEEINKSGVRIKLLHKKYIEDLEQFRDPSSGEYFNVVQHINATRDEFDKKMAQHNAPK